MSLLIHIDDPSIPNFMKYEIELIKSVAIMNQIWIESYEPESLCLPCMGIKYKNDKGFDQIDHISEMIRKGYGKCDSIVAWFLTLYNLYNIEAEPILVKRSEQELHAQLKVFENNKVQILDPSVNLIKLSKVFCSVCGGNFQ